MKMNMLVKMWKMNMIMMNKEEKERVRKRLK